MTNHLTEESNTQASEGEDIFGESADQSDSNEEGHRVEKEKEEEEKEEEDEEEEESRVGKASNKRSEAPEDDLRGSPRKKVPRVVWEVKLDRWQPVDTQLQRMLERTEASGLQHFRYQARGQRYAVDVARMAQFNERTGAVRELRRSNEVRDASSEIDEDDDLEDSDEMPDEIADEPARPSKAPARCERHAKLVERLMSPAVQVPLPAEVAREPARLTSDEVEKVFVDHVSGVKNFLYRDMHGQHSMGFIKAAYRDGIRAFHGTAVHEHLLALMRLIVHHGHARGAGAASYLSQVAEAFRDCQAVQARVIEQVGLEIRGVVLDFRGLVTKLVGDYKGVAVKMLAHDRIQRRLACDDGNPTHYENRLIADLGEPLGLNKDDIRRATLDEHAASRFPRLVGKAREQAVAHARELFDLDALLKVLMAEVNSFSAESSTNSLPRMFLDWAASRLTEKHVVFDEDACCRVDVGEPLALAMLEDLFVEHPSTPADEVYRGRRLRELFQARP